MAYFVIIFFNSALIFAAHERLAGGDPNIRSGLNGAMQSVVTIFMWAIVAATVGLILNILSSQARQRGGIMGFISYIIVSMLGAAWSLITFFVVPLIVIEHRSIGDAFKSSFSMLKRTWGEQVVANFGLGIAGFIFMLIAAGITALLFFVLSPLGGIGVFLALVFGVILIAGVALGVRGSGRHLQGGPVQLRNGRLGAQPLPGRRHSGRVPPAVGQGLATRLFLPAQAGIQSPCDGGR